jgi:hypothetical protein
MMCEHKMHIVRGDMYNTISIQLGSYDESSDKTGKTLSVAHRPGHMGNYGRIAISNRDDILLWW